MKMVHLFQKSSCDFDAHDTGPEPNKCTFGSLKDVLHQIHLSPPFSKTRLINTDLINPDPLDMTPIQSDQVRKCLLESLGDHHCSPIAEHWMGSVGISPAIAQAIVLWELAEIKGLKVAFNHR
jgi:hypothetical protein